jgi:hypothetical protein
LPTIDDDAGGTSSGGTIGGTIRLTIEDKAPPPANAIQHFITPVAHQH